MIISVIIIITTTSQVSHRHYRYAVAGVKILIVVKIIITHSLS